MPLIFSRRLSATGITVDQPEINMLQSASGAWNYAGLGDPPGQPDESGLDLSVRLVKVTNGRITIGKVNSKTQPLVVDKVNAELRDFSATSVMPFSLTANFSGGGELSAQGTAGPFHAGDMTLTPAQVSLKVSHLDLAVAGVMEGETGMGGVVALEGNAKADGQNADVTGKIEAEQLKLVKGGGPAKRPVEIDFALRHDLKARGGRLTQGDVHVGGAVIHMTGTYAPQGEATVLNMNIAGAGMPVPELESILPAVNVVLPVGSSLAGGTAEIKMAVAGPTDRLMATGSLGVYKTTLKGFDLGAKMSAIEKLAGMKGGPDTEIDTLTANVKASQGGGAELDKISLAVPSIGDLTGAGTISPSNQLDFRLKATVHTGGLLALAGKTAIPVAVKGTAANPVFVPDVKALATQEVKSLVDAPSTVGGVLGGLFGGKTKK
jgi:AsmA protein